MTHGAISFAELDRLTGGRLGLCDVPCPLCGPDRRDARNRRRQVLRVWKKQPDFASFKCARCGVEGWAKADGPAQHRAFVATRPTDHRTADDGEDHARRQLAKARALWRRRRPAEGSIVEPYLRECRRYGGPIPATIGYLPPSKPEHHPAMVAAFGLCEEPEPGELAIADEAVRGIHLTFLIPDGSGKADVDPNKIMVGSSSGWPIVLAPPNDLLGLTICEGIETGLSLFEATGLGVWAAGAASRMPALADKVPGYIDCVTIAAEPDDGEAHAQELARRLQARGLHVEMCILGEAEGRTP